MFQDTGEYRTLRRSLLSAFPASSSRSVVLSSRIHCHLLTVRTRRRPARDWSSTARERVSETDALDQVTDPDGDTKRPLYRNVAAGGDQMVEKFGQDVFSVSYTVRAGMFGTSVSQLPVPGVSLYAGMRNYG